MQILKSYSTQQYYAYTRQADICFHLVQIFFWISVIFDFNLMQNNWNY